MAYSNNSVIPLHDIGEGTAYLTRGKTAALFCVTNLVSCCRGADGVSAGEWYLPGESVPVVNDNDPASGSSDFTRERGPSAILLHRMKNGVGPTGVYNCNVPDENELVQHLYIGVGLGMQSILSHVTLSYIVSFITQLPLLQSMTLYIITPLYL